MKMENLLRKVKETVKTKKIQAAMLLYAVFAPIGKAYATNAADAKWTAVIGFLLPWIQRLGGVVILLGAIEFGLAFKNDDAEAKTKGLRTVIAGCIVLAVGVSSSIFLI